MLFRHWLFEKLAQSTHKHRRGKEDVAGLSLLGRIDLTMTPETRRKYGGAVHFEAGNSTRADELP